MVYTNGAGQAEILDNVIKDLIKRVRCVAPEGYRADLPISCVTSNSPNPEITSIPAETYAKTLVLTEDCRGKSNRTDGMYSFRVEGGS